MRKTSQCVQDSVYDKRSQISNSSHSNELIFSDMKLKELIDYFTKKDLVLFEYSLETSIFKLSLLGNSSDMERRQQTSSAFL